MYLDGRAQWPSQSYYAQRYWTPQPWSFAIGTTYGPYEPWYGQLDDVAMFDYALTGPERLDVLNGNFQPWIQPG